MACDFPLPDIERARTIIDALGAMVVGEPCPACSGQGRATAAARSSRSTSSCCSATRFAEVGCAIASDLESPLTGGCGCGRVRFEARALLWASYCHCRRCQIRTGAPASVQARVEPGSVQVVAGEDLLRAWAPEDGLEKVFCGECGSALFGRRRGGAIVRVRLGAFDGDPGIAPVAHQYVAYAAPWAKIPDDGLPRYPEQPPADGPPGAAGR